jgi:hypothetical protein
MPYVTVAHPMLELRVAPPTFVSETLMRARPGDFAGRRDRSEATKAGGAADRDEGAETGRVRRRDLDFRSPGVRPGEQADLCRDPMTVDPGDVERRVVRVGGEEIKGPVVAGRGDTPERPAFPGDLRDLLLKRRQARLERRGAGPANLDRQVDRSVLMAARGDQVALRVDAAGHRRSSGGAGKLMAVTPYGAVHTLSWVPVPSSVGSNRRDWVISNATVSRRTRGLDAEAGRPADLAGHHVRDRGEDHAVLGAEQLPS